MSSPSIIDTARHPLANGCPPAWASGWGQDRYGVFVEFTFHEVTQRLRWISPGQFWMGSPEEETRKLSELEWEFAGEHPRHLVILAEGFWLFDTPCTQALWEAVMGNNPSRFKSPTRPVEQMSWHGVQTFLGKINEQIPDLALTLPSEAQWEYACRSGTETAIYSGELQILSNNNAPALDPIAWYSGNSGVDFDLPEGEDSSSWPKKQYPHTRAGTRPVKLKRANPWGLYDMLGNVWEWCRDGLRNYDTDVQINPEGSLQVGADHVLRGGSWSGDARHVRAAYRHASRPVHRPGILGFRCARLQA